LGEAAQLEGTLHTLGEALPTDQMELHSYRIKVQTCQITPQERVPGCQIGVHSCLISLRHMPDEGAQLRDKSAQLKKQNHFRLKQAKKKIRYKGL